MTRNALLFPAPAESALLYVGEVMHQRLKPFGHRFTYRVAAVLVDIDRLAELPRASRLIAHNRFALFSIHDADLGAGDGRPLRPHVDELLAAAGVDPAGMRVLLLTYPRVLGYVFNPISVYWCYAADGALAAVIYEVRNTFGGRHSYVAPVQAGQLGPEGLKQERDKAFYVSPFIGEAMRYLFRLRPPGDAVALRILETDQDGPLLSATFRGVKRPLTNRHLLGTFLALPLMTLKVIAGIHWEALRLWWKGAAYHPPAAAGDRI